MTRTTETTPNAEREAALEDLLTRFGLVLTDDPDFDHDEQTFEQAKASFVAALTTPALSSEREAVLEEAARFVEQWNGDTRDGDTFLIAEELRALKATPAPAVSTDEIVAVLDSTRHLVAACAPSGFTDKDAVMALYENNAALTAILSRIRGEGE